MAVQAQYPSNVLPFHRSEAEMKKTANDALATRQIQQGPSSGFMDPHHALFFPGVAGSNPNNNDISGNNCGTSNPNTRKRARDAVVQGGGGGGVLLSPPPVFPPTCDQDPTSSAAAFMGARGLVASSSQPMLQQVLMTPSLLLGGAGFSQLHPQKQQQPQEDVPISMVSTGLRLSLEDQQQQQQQQQPRHGILVPPLSDDLAAVVKQHREEIDRYILMQGEHLRRSIADSRRRQLRTLVSAAEESASRKLREKQSELERASRTRSDLEARAARLAAEAAAWQAKARAGEAAAAALRAQLDRAAEHAQAAGGVVASDGGANDRGAGSDAASACVDPRREEMERQAAAGTGSTSSRPLPRSPVSCRQCGNGGASVVLLPCRHLCLCASCSQDAALPAVCPVCFCARSVAVEVFFG